MAFFGATANSQTVVHNAINISNPSLKQHIYFSKTTADALKIKELFLPLRLSNR
jgi:hypothetical protein